MTIFLVLLLTVMAFACATYPLLKRKSSLSADSTGDDNLEEMQTQRDTTYSMLKELEFDYQSGILSEDDYEALRNRYKRKAATILRDMDGLQEGTDDDEIEERVLALRQRKSRLSQGSDTVDKIEEKVLELRQSKGRFCPQCGARHEADDRFCTHCGTELLKDGK